MKARTLLILAGFVVLASFLTPATAFQASDWRTFVVCTTSHDAQVDPIVAPGQVSAHVHAFSGNTRTSEDPSYGRMTALPLESSCELARDTAGYWVPVARNSATGEVRAPTRWNVYYVNPWKNSSMVAFPPDFKAVSDDIEVLGPGSNVESGAGVRIWFRRSCWDGTLGMISPDLYRAHTRTPSGNGSCPTGFGTLLPKVHYNVRWDTISNMAGWEPISALQGVGWHGDLWNTWHQPSLDALVAACLNAPALAGGNGCARITGEQDYVSTLRARGVVAPDVVPPPPPPPPPVDPEVQALLDAYASFGPHAQATVNLILAYLALTPEQQAQFTEGL